MATTALFTAAQLGDTLGFTVTTARAAAVEAIVWGWLKPVLGVTERPDPVTPELFSWAVELGAIAHENPSGLSYYQLGEERRGFSAERRQQVLAEAADGGVPGAASRPRGCFPTAQDWPDPLRQR